MQHATKKVLPTFARSEVFDFVCIFRGLWGCASFSLSLSLLVKLSRELIVLLCKLHCGVQAGEGEAKTKELSAQGKANNKQAREVHRIWAGQEHEKPKPTQLKY